MRDDEVTSRKLAKRLRGTMTNAEVILWSRLRREGMRGLRFRRQHPIGPYIADFACTSLRLVVEIDGETHGTDAERAHDAHRNAYMSERGWRTIRFGNTDIYENLDSVLDAIWRELPHFPPPRSGGGGGAQRRRRG